MKDNRIDRIINQIDHNFMMDPVVDLQVAKDLITRNYNIIRDYPSIETLIRTLDYVIKTEMEDRDKLNQSSSLY